eukprot:2036024-Pleurochrysis_carterae.AAC.1
MRDGRTRTGKGSDGVLSALSLKHVPFDDPRSRAAQLPSDCRISSAWTEETCESAKERLQGQSGRSYGARGVGARVSHWRW